MWWEEGRCGQHYRSRRSQATSLTRPSKLTSAASNDKMEFVNEEDDAAVVLFALFDDGFYSLFILSLVLCAGHEGSEVEGEELADLREGRKRRRKACTGQYSCEQVLSEGLLSVKERCAPALYGNRTNRHSPSSLAHLSE